MVPHNKSHFKTKKNIINYLHSNKQNIQTSGEPLANDNNNSEIRDIVHTVLEKLRKPEENDNFSECTGHIDVSVRDIQNIMWHIKSIFLKEGALLKLGKNNRKNDKYCVFGDIHGQYWDMVSQLSSARKLCPDMKYLFLGDLVDRGDHSVEVILSLFCWKILYPNEVYLIRGNHESREVNSRYGFLNELVSIFGVEVGRDVFNLINNVFDCMPISATLYDRYFCVHGGLSTHLNKIDELDVQLPTGLGVPGELLNDVTWSDPNVSNPQSCMIRNNGRSLKYGEIAVNKFMRNNPGINTIIRAHQVVDEGVKTDFNNKVITVFSAPRYKRRMENRSAVLLCNATEIHAVQFTKEKEVVRLNQPTKLKTTNTIRIK
jgi:diadenosine tetraphosphatase ApaH/serine/threonine PP2A family protein phosphatase